MQKFAKIEQKRECYCSNLRIILKAGQTMTQSEEPLWSLLVKASNDRQRQYLNTLPAIEKREG